VSVCQCGATAKPERIDGILVDLPPGWVTMQVTWRPISSWVLCPDCVVAVVLALDVRAGRAGRTDARRRGRR